MRLGLLQPIYRCMRADRVDPTEAVLTAVATSKRLNASHVSVSSVVVIYLDTTKLIQSHTFAGKQPNEPDSPELRLKRATAP